MEVLYCEYGNISPQRIVEIFNTAGWIRETKDVLTGFENSYYVVAYVNNTAIGFARAISDQCYYTSIYDVIVIPEYQNKGVGTKLIEILLAKFKHTNIYLTHTPDKESFYEKFGFEKIDNGMKLKRNSYQRG